MNSSLTPTAEIRKLSNSLPDDTGTTAPQEKAQRVKLVRPPSGVALKIMPGGTMALVNPGNFIVIPPNALRVTLIIENRSTLYTLYIGGDENNRPVPGKNLGIEVRPLERAYLDVTGEISLAVNINSVYVNWTEITTGEGQ